MEPLAHAHFRSVIGEAAQRELGIAGLVHQTHVEVAVIGGALRLLMASRSFPRLWKIEQGIPVHHWDSAKKEFGRSFQPEQLDLFRAKARDAYLGHPDR